MEAVARGERMPESGWSFLFLVSWLKMREICLGSSNSWWKCSGSRAIDWHNTRETIEYAEFPEETRGMASRKKWGCSHPVALWKRLWGQTWKGRLCLKWKWKELSMGGLCFLCEAGEMIIWECGEEVGESEVWEAWKRFERENGGWGARGLEKPWRVVEWYWEPCWGAVMSLSLICPVVWLFPAMHSLRVAKHGQGLFSCCVVHCSE